MEQLEKVQKSHSHVTVGTRSFTMRVLTNRWRCLPSLLCLVLSTLSVRVLNATSSARIVDRFVGFAQNGATITYLEAGSDNADLRFRQAWVRSEKPILTGSDVDCAQVRDLAILKDTSNRAVLENGSYVAYFFGRHLPSGLIDTYRAESADLKSWKNFELVLPHGLVNVDEQYAGVGTVIRFGPGDYRMWYQALSLVTLPKTIALATSVDGKTWSKKGSVLLGSGLQNAYDLAVPWVCRLTSGDFVMLVEGNGLNEAVRKWRVYGYSSPDAVHWAPLNGGSPLLDLGQIGAWDSVHVANPKLVESGSGKFVIEYNGGSKATSSDAAFQIGFAEATVLGGPYVKDAANPYIGRRLSPVNYGVETSCWVRDVSGTKSLHFVQDYPGNSRTSSIYRCNPVLDRGTLLRSDLASSAVLAGRIHTTQFRATCRSYICAGRDDTTADALLLSMFDAGFVIGGTSKTLQDLKRIQIRRAAASSANPGDVLIEYVDRTLISWYWSGTSWILTPTYIAADLERPIEVSIEDRGVNYGINVLYADTSENIIGTTVPKASVRPFKIGRVAVIGDPYTDAGGGQLFVTSAKIIPDP